MLKFKKEKTKRSKSQLIIVGSLLIILGTCVIGSKYLYNYYLQENEQELLDSFYNVQKKIVEDRTSDEEETTTTDVPTTNTTNTPTTNYVAVLKVPRIGLEKGLCDLGTSCNNVNKNIQILRDSDYPNVENGNFMLAGHSGSGRTAYFKNLNKLKIDDEVSVYFDGKLYTYKVVNTYDIEKTGEASIVRNAEKTTLTLITCRHNTNKQIIYICELIDIK